MSRRTWLLLVVLLAALVPACWSLAADEEPDPCAMGYGGDDGFGGEGGGGFGGGDVGTGFGGSDVGTGIGGSDVGVGPSSSDVGVGPSSSDVGVGPSSGAGGGFGARPAPHRARRWRRHRRGGLGVAQQADCPYMIPPYMYGGPDWQPLTTAKLRQIAIQNNIDGCASQTGIQQNRTIGLSFEDWVLTTIGRYPKPPGEGRNEMPFPSQERKMQNNGLPASVIPELVAGQLTTHVDLGAMTVTQDTFPNSAFFEVKAVKSTITLGTSQYRILGLLDVAHTLPTVPDAGGPYPPPLVDFITTGGTVVSSSVVTKATGWSVAVWQQSVSYDANSAHPNNPDLRLEDATCLNPSLYAGLPSYKVSPGRGRSPR